MSNYYAVCNVNGPISLGLKAEDESGAKAEFAALGEIKLQGAIDAARTDAEEDLEIEGEGMTESEFDCALFKAGAEPVCSLKPIVNAHAGTVAHEAGGWYLWRAEEE